jgi:hypothetical protein
VPESQRRGEFNKEAKSYHANKTSFFVSQLFEFAQIEREKEIELAPQVQPERGQ